MWNNRSMSSNMPSMPGVGDEAPDFSLPGTPDGDPVSLASFRGSGHVLLAFYVFDFSPG
jgi:peroxiredoxin